jgi:hypothetical protein
MDSYHRSNPNAASSNGRGVLEKVSSPSDKPINSRSASTADECDVIRTNVEKQAVSIDVRQEYKHHSSPQRQNPLAYHQHQSEAIISPISRDARQLSTQGEANEYADDDLSIESLPDYHPPVKVVDVPSAVRLAKVSRASYVSFYL